MNKSIITELPKDTIVSLYKVIKNNPELPNLEKSMHVYLSGIISRSINPEYNKVYQVIK